MPSEEKRDPKLDPIAGDVLRGKYYTGSACRRRVTGTTPLGNIFLKERGMGERIIGIQEWREWAATAEVIKRGDE